MAKKDEAIEERIYNEIIVDAYDDGEVNMSWYYYMEEQLMFPFEAEAWLKKRDGTKVKADILIESIFSDPEEPLKLGFTLLEGLDYLHSIDVGDLIAVDTTADNLQVLNDWRYWKRLSLL